MLKNYLTIAYRNIKRNKIYSLINILGLSTGIAVSLFILLWVQDEITWDGFHKNKDWIYQVMMNKVYENKISTQAALPFALANELERTIPEVKHAVEIDWGGSYLLAYKNKKLNISSNFVGEDFFQVFTFELLKGSQKNPLEEANTIVLTESKAKALFGDEDPINKIITFNNKHLLKVTGILKDIPLNSTFQFDCLVPFSFLLASDRNIKARENNFSDNSYRIFTELKEGSNKEQVNQKVKDIIKKRLPEESGWLFLNPLINWHLHSQFENGVSVGGRILYVRMFIIIAMLILLIACINFMNLATARSERRAREVGVRKAIGSDRKELIYQFLVESMLVTTVAFMLAIILIFLLLPSFNNLVEKQLTIPFGNPLYYLTSLILVVLIGLVAGSYPAFYLSSFNPAQVLKGTIRVGKNAVIPRKVLVSVQFTFSILLVIGTIVIYKQLQHVKDRPMGYNKENLLQFEMNDELLKNFEAFKNDLISSGAASSLCASSSPVTDIYSHWDDDQFHWPGKVAGPKTLISVIFCGYDYSKTLGVKVLQGRDFSKEFPSDSLGVILNESAVKLMDLKDPIGQIITIEKDKLHVVGVLKNMVMTNPYEPVAPTLIFLNNEWPSRITVKIASTKDISKALSTIENIYSRYSPSFTFDFSFVDQEFDKKFKSEQLVGKLANLFASFAIFISCLGLFGLAAFAAEQRKKEIGIRKTLGASVRQIAALLSSDFLKLVLISFVIASPIGYFLMEKWLQSFHYRITIEVWVFMVAGMFAIVVTVATVSFQAIKAAMVNPVESLKSE